MALSAGQDPDRISMRDGLLIVMAMHKAQRAPAFEEFFGVERRPFAQLGISNVGGRRTTSAAVTAEDYELLVASGLAVRGAEA